jgi:hydrogenase maturation protease
MLSLQPPADVAPVLVLAIGNPSRGDDALGPLAAQAVAELALRGVEVLTDFQLQVEHALDLLGRRRVVFIDAAADGDSPFKLRPLAPAADASHPTHSLSPSAVLDAYRRLTGAEPPPAQLLAIRGHEFELGAPPSRAASANLRAALAVLTPSLRETPSRVREPQLPA